jgi:hypothetical protein
VVPATGDTIARSSSHQRIQQRGFSDVRPANDRHLDRALLRLRLFRAFVAREILRDVLQQLVEPDPMLGRNREQVLESERMKFVRQALPHRGVDLVHRQRHGLAEFPQHFRQVAIGARDFRPSIDQEDNLSRLIQRHARLFQNFGGDHLGVVRDDAAGVDQIKAPAKIGRFALDAVPRDPRLIADYRPALSQDRVE